MAQQPPRNTASRPRGAAKRTTAQQQQQQQQQGEMSLGLEEGKQQQQHEGDQLEGMQPPRKRASRPRDQQLGLPSGSDPMAPAVLANTPHPHGPTLQMGQDTMGDGAAAARPVKMRKVGV
jgi:hypothetical protein